MNQETECITKSQEFYEQNLKPRIEEFYRQRWSPRGGIRFVPEVDEKAWSYCYMMFQRDSVPGRRNSGSCFQERRGLRLLHHAGVVTGAEQTKRKSILTKPEASGPCQRPCGGVCVLLQDL
jgi:hypothetical protein